MSRSYQRFAAWALITGTLLATIGYVTSGSASTDTAHFTSPAWLPLYSVALAGDFIMVTGLPLILAANGDRARRLTAAGTAGLYLAVVMLNIGEGTIEGFVKPYLVRHGGIPASVAGFGQYETVALAALGIGLLALGVAVIRGRTLGWWVGALFLATLVLEFAPLPGSLREIPDYLAYAALFTIGVKTLRALPRAVAADAPVPVGT